MTSIAPITHNDRAEWLPLWNGYLAFHDADLGQTTTATTFERLADPESEIHGVIARDDDGVAVGIVHWQVHPATWTITNYCYLEDLFVAPDARGRGVARALIEHVRQWAERHGSAKVYWLTGESNAPARALYDQVSTRTGLIQYQIKTG